MPKQWTIAFQPNSNLSCQKMTLCFHSMFLSVVFKLVSMEYCTVSSTFQVVAAVGFKGKRLEIPSDLNPQVAAMIEACWIK